MKNTSKKLQKSFKRSLAVLVGMALIMPAMLMTSCIEDDGASLNWPVPEEFPEIDRPSDPDVPVDPDNNPPDKSTWKVVSVTTVWQAGFEAEKIFDNNITTYWHASTNGTWPQVFVINMQDEFDIKSLGIINRQWDEHSPNSIPKGIKLEISDDGSSWTEVLSSEMPDQRGKDASRGEELFVLESPVKASFFRFSILNNWDGAGYTYLAEINLY